MLPDMSALIGAKIVEPRQSEEEYLHRLWLAIKEVKTYFPTHVNENYGRSSYEMMNILFGGNQHLLLINTKAKFESVLNMT